jgi:uncharacterized protein (TIRG00374 family)
MRTAESHAAPWRAIRSARGGEADLGIPAELSQRHLRRRLLIAVGLLAAVVAVVTLLPGLASLRTRFSHAEPGWLVLGVGLKLLSGLSYVVIFRAVFCNRMRWRHSYEIGMSELGANALFPTGGAGGLALGAWALRRGGMPSSQIARRTVAFFLLTSVPNVLGVVIVGVGLAVGLFPGHASLALTLLPAAIAALAIVATLAIGRLAGRLHGRLADTRAGSKRVAALSAIAEGVDEALALLREHDWQLIGGLIGYLAFDVMILWATFHAFGASPPLAIIWIAYLIGELGGLLPVPGGIGGVDAGLVGTFVLYGVAVTPVTAAVLTYRAIALWVPAVFGATAFVALRRTLRTEADQLAACAPGGEMDVIGLGPTVVERVPAEAPAPAIAGQPSG